MRVLLRTPHHRRLHLSAAAYDAIISPSEGLVAGGVFEAQAQRYLALGARPARDRLNRDRVEGGSLPPRLVSGTDTVQDVENLRVLGIELAREEPVLLGVRSGGKLLLFCV